MRLLPGIDEKTLDYMRLTGREESQIALTEAYAKAQGMWIAPATTQDPFFTDIAVARPRQGCAQPCRSEASAGPGDSLTEPWMT